MPKYDAYLGLKLTSDQMDLLKAVAAQQGFWIGDPGEKRTNKSKAVRYLIDKEIAWIEEAAGSGDDTAMSDRSMYEQWKAYKLARGEGVPKRKEPKPAPGYEFIEE